MITPRDEFFHERNDDPHWNESGWFSFMVPERSLSGMMYRYHVWPCYPNIYSFFTHFEWSLDGLVASGEEQEWIPINQRRRFVRATHRG